MVTGRNRQFGGQPISPVGETVRRLRLAAGLTQQELATRSGLSVRALHDLERGRSRQPRANSIRRLAEVLAPDPADRAELLSLLAGAPAQRQGLHVGILGPVVLSRDGQPVTVPTHRLRTILGLLALNRSRAVATSEIIDVVWGERPPRTARNLVQMYVGELRTILGPAGRVLRSTDGGYALHLADDEIDLAEFDELVNRAHAERDAGRPERAAECYMDALQCWRGPILADAGDRLRQDPGATAAVRRRIAATVAFADVAIGLGASEQAVDALRELGHSEPLHEAVQAKLMLALAAAGERAEALRVFAEFRARLSDELGIEPGPEVRAVHVNILRGLVPDTADGARPADLPPDPAMFTGRRAEMDRILAAVTGGDRSPGRSPIVAISGVGGVGKSTLAVHAAHQLTDTFPDGTLYVDLQGSTAPLRPVDPLDVLTQWLPRLGAGSSLQPTNLQVAAARFRSLMARRRMLVVLDNAADEVQVRPLLPASPTCAVLVTSRGVLAALDGAVGIHLDVLTEPEAITLLGRLTASASAVPADATDLVRLCDHLPLAIRIAAARLTLRPAWSLRDLVDRLADTQRRLDELQVADLGVRASFSVSYQDLEPRSARLFRLLGLPDVADISTATAAVLADCTTAQACDVLDALADAQLVIPIGHDRYRMHDLIRLYARERAHEEEDHLARHGALQRLLEYYCSAATQATHLLFPAEARRIDRDRLRDPHPALTMTTGADAVTWIDAEHANVVRVVQQAARAASVDRTLLLRVSEALDRPLRIRRHLREQQAVRQLAADIAQQISDLPALALAYEDLAHGCHGTRRSKDAAKHASRALRMWRQLGDTDGELSCLFVLGEAHRRLERYEDAKHDLDQALRMCRQIGHRRGEAIALDLLGLVHQSLRQFASAIDCHRQSAAIQSELGNDRHLALVSRTNLAWALHRVGRNEDAIDEFRTGVAVGDDIGDCYGQAERLWGLGEAYKDLGRLNDARIHWHASIDILVGIGELTDSQARRLRQQAVPDTPDAIRLNI